MRPVYTIDDLVSRDALDAGADKPARLAVLGWPVAHSASPGMHQPALDTEKIDARYILRGLRTSADFEFERSIGQMNKKMLPDIETIFLLTTPEYTALNSSIVRDIIRNGGDASAFVPRQVVF